MKVTVLSSGSKGNSTLVETDNLNILIDTGLPLSNLEKRLERTFPHIDVLVITHSHIDHIKGINSVIKKFNPIVFTHSPAVIEKYDKNINKENEIILNGISISLFPLSHDVPCTGVSIKDLDKELIYITDTGYINKKVLNKILNKDMYIIESNHNVEMLRHGKYPFFLQQRILGDSGHLSNEDTVKYLNQVVGNKTKHIILAHLSEENNSIEKVSEALKQLTPNVNKPIIAKQEKSLETIEV